MAHAESSGRTDERGMALAVAVFALALMGGLVAGNFVAGLLEQQSGRNTLFALQAAEAAEAELRQALLLAPASTLTALEAGAAHPLGSVTRTGIMVDREVVRLTGNLFLIRTRGSRMDAEGRALATRRLGLLVKLEMDSTNAAAVMPLTQRPWVQLY